MILIKGDHHENKEKDAAILIVTAGDMKIDNSKFKHFFDFGGCGAGSGV